MHAAAAAAYAELLRCNVRFAFSIGSNHAQTRDRQDSYTQNAEKQSATFGTRVVPLPPRPSPATRSSSTLAEVDMLSLDAEGGDEEGQVGGLLQNALIRLARASELNMNRAPTPLIKSVVYKHLRKALQYKVMRTHGTPRTTQGGDKSS